MLATQGDTAGAFRAFEAGIALAESVESEPALASQLVRYAVHINMMQALWLALGTTDLAPEQAHHLYFRLRQIDLTPAFVHSLQYECAYGLLVINNINADPSKLAEAQTLSGERKGRGLGERLWTGLYCSFLGKPLRKLDKLTYLRLFQRQLAAAKLPYRESKQEHESLRREWEKLPAWDVATRILFPIYSRISARRDAVEAQLGACQIGLALNVYHQRFHRYPATLAELERTVGWPLPKDPFSGKAYVYRREGKDLLLYSWGPDLRDDGGRSTNLPSRTQKGDMVWRWQH